MAFPTLFPDGKGDPTNPAILKNATLKEKVKHLIKFEEKKDSKWIYRFANHPRFSYWALNMIQRKQILQQTGIFFKTKSWRTTFNYGRTERNGQQ